MSDGKSLGEATKVKLVTEAHAVPNCKVSQRNSPLSSVPKSWRHTHDQRTARDILEQATAQRQEREGSFGVRRGGRVKEDARWGVL